MKICDYTQIERSDFEHPVWKEPDGKHAGTHVVAG